MGVLDKFLNAMRLNDDDSFDDDDFLDDEIDDYEEQSRRKKSFKRLEDEDDNDDFDYQESQPLRSKAKPQAKSKAAASSSSKVSPMRPRKTNSGMEVCVIKPHTMEDAREITETLLSNCTVVLNLEGLDVDIAQRIIDFTSGSCYAVSGNLQKISNYIFIITPSSVDISGDFQEILNGAFDVPSVHNKF